MEESQEIYGYIELIKKTVSKTAHSTTTSIETALRPYINTIKSITYDNGNEFSMHVSSVCTKKLTKRLT